MNGPLDRLESLFAAALQEPPADRAVYLDQACVDDPALRQRVEALLRAQGAAGSFLEPPATPPFDTVDEVPVAERPGAVIGPYKLMEEIGEGGMGLVFVAEQQQPVRRRVALKIIKPGMDTRQVVARFEAERQALALMDHTNIAHVFDGGTTTSGRPYFVMELVKGVPITRFCDGNHLSVRQRLELFLDVCSAVQHAHQKGVIHRDLKPSNVMVTSHDGTPVVKVIDFGVAKAIGQRLTDKTLYTQLSQMVGTPLYMSPEQAGQSGLDVDTRSDVYALGVLLYELLTGMTPFDGERLRTVGIDEMRRIIRDEEPARPSTRISTLGLAANTVSTNRQSDPRKLSQLVRGELDWVAMKALEKDRTRRYESASAFAADVGRYLHDEPVQACPPSAAYRVRKFAQRHKGPVAAGVALSSLLVLGTVGTSLGLAWALRAERAATAAAEAAQTQRDRALAAEKLATDRLAEVTKEKNRATTAEERAKDEAAIAYAVNEFLQNDLLGEAAPDKNPRDKKVTVEEVLGRASARIAGKFGKQPRVEAVIRRTIGATYRKLGDYSAAQAQLERSLELYRRTLGKEHPDTLNAMNSLAVLYEARGQYAKAEPLQAKAVDVSSRVLGEEHPDTLNYMQNLAGLYRVQGRYAEAEPLQARALKDRRRVLGEEHPDTLISMNNLGVLYRNWGQYAEAEPLQVKALEVGRRVRGEEHPDTLTFMHNLALLYTVQRQYAKAEPLQVKALEVGRRVFGEEHHNTLKSKGNLAMLYWSMGRLERSIPMYQELLGSYRARYGDDHPDTLGAQADLGINYRDAGRLDDGIRCLEEALANARARSDGLPAKLAWITGELIVLYEQTKQFAKSEALCRGWLRQARQKYGGQDLTTAGALAGLGRSLLKQQKYADAEPALRECLNIREQKQPDDWHLFNSKSMLGGSLLGQKKYADAEPLLLAGYEGIRERVDKVPVIYRARLTEALERLVELYDATGRKEQAVVWRAKLETRREADKRAGKPEQK